MKKTVASSCVKFTSSQYSSIYHAQGCRSSATIKALHSNYNDLSTNSTVL